MNRTVWDEDAIKAGFEIFFSEHGRLPTAPEIDSLDYLPSSRQIQRKFGGLESLRDKLGYKDIHFGKGDFRKEIALKSNKRGRDAEIELEKLLREKFNDVFVHTEKIFDETKSRVDFYVYCPEGNFGIDIFTTSTFKDLQKNVNIKIDKYHNFEENLYFLVEGNAFDQKTLDDYTSAKKKGLPSKTRIVNIETLLEIIKNKTAYIDPTNK